MLLDSVRSYIGITTLIAGKKQTGVEWGLSQKTYVTIFTAQGDDKTPVKGGTSDNDVLYVSGGQ